MAWEKETLGWGMGWVRDLGWVRDWGMVTSFVVMGRVVTSW